MPQHFSSSPLFGICDTRFQSLIRVFIHNLLKTFHDSECISQAASKATVNISIQLPNLLPISFNSCAALRNLPISYDYSLVISFQSQDSRMVPLHIREMSLNSLQEHTNLSIQINYQNQNFIHHIFMFHHPINQSQVESTDKPQNSFLLGEEQPKMGEEQPRISTGGKQPRMSKHSSYKNWECEDEGKDIKLINGNGIISRYQLVLIVMLGLISVVSVESNRDPIKQHIRYLQMYLNKSVLGNDDLGLYEEGQNIDESSTEIVSFGEMRRHLLEHALTIVKTYQSEGIANYSYQGDAEVVINFVDRNDVLTHLTFSTSKQAANYLQSIDLKPFLLRLKHMQFQIQLGNNKYLHSLAVIINYQVHSQLMLKVTLDLQYQILTQYQVNLEILRIFQQLLALCLLISYCKQLYHIKLYKLQTDSLYACYSTVSEHNFKNIRNSLKNWYISLIFLSLIVILSAKFAPLCSFLQFLPIFQFPEDHAEQKNEMTYNFNKNLRHSLPLILSIMLQLYIFLNGFIFYSMLMYPGEYFDDYLHSFFSYIYQNFQVGTYQIFVELKDHGNFAYVIYMLLYFYVFMIGNSLIPALFCLLIQMRVTEKEIKKFVVEKTLECVCPKCHSSNELFEQNNVEITVTSPKLSPLIHSQNKKEKKNNHGNDREEAKDILIFIEEDVMRSSEIIAVDKSIKLNQKIIQFSDKLRNLLSNLNHMTSKFKGNLKFKKRCLKKIKKFFRKQFQK